MIVSGLNHSLHKIVERSNLVCMLIDAGVDPDGIPQMTSGELLKLDQAVFATTYAEIGNPKLIVDREMKNKGSTYGIDQPIEGSDRVAPISVEEIKFGVRAFTSFLQLASTMGHEFRHGLDFVHGDYKKWIKEDGYNAADNKLELSARYWQISHSAPTDIALFGRIMFFGINAKHFY